MSSKPRILFDSIPYKAGLVGGWWTPPNSEDSAAPSANAFNWRLGDSWSPKATSNLVTNGDYLKWTAGPSAAPDSWTLTGAGATVARDGTVYKVPIYSAALTRVGADAALTQNVVATDPGEAVRYRAGAWVHCDTANAARIALYDGVSTVYSSYHSGTPGWEWLSMTHGGNGGQTLVRAECRVDNTNATAKFDGFVVVESPGNTDEWLEQSPHEPQTGYVYFEPSDGNLLQNHSLKNWTLGPTVAPDSWVLSGAAATVDKLNNISGRKVGPNLAYVRRSAADCDLSQALSAANLEKVKGKAISAGAWTIASVATRVRVSVAITLRDGSTVYTTSSGYHTGGSTLEWLEIENLTVPHDATAVTMKGEVNNGTVAGYFSGFWLGLGATATPTPHSKAATAFAVAGHNLGSTGCGIALQKSSDNVTWTDVVATISPATDHVIWRDFNSVSAPYWRIKVTGGAGKQRPSIGMVAFGEYLELPYFFPPGFNIYQQRVQGRVDESPNGRPLGRGVRDVPRRIRIEQDWITETQMVDDVLDWLDHAGANLTSVRGTGRGLPFFLQWEDTDHESWDSLGHKGGPLFCWIPSGADVQAPLVEGMAIERLSVECLAVNS